HPFQLLRPPPRFPIVLWALDEPTAFHPSYPAVGRRELRVCALAARWVHPGPDANPWDVLRKFKAALFAAAKVTRRSAVAVATAALRISLHIKLLHLV